MSQPHGMCRRAGAGLGERPPPLLPAPQTGTRPPSKAVAGGLRRANGLEELGGGRDAD